jgi:hypothetical protein
MTLTMVETVHDERSERLQGDLRASTVNGSSGRLFPWFLCRVATLPAEASAAFGAPATVASIRLLDDLTRQVAADRDAVTAVLYHLIGETPSPQVRGKLLAARRALFRGECPSEAILAHLRAEYPAVAGLITEFREVLGHQTASIKTVEQRYDLAREAERRALAQWCQDEAFQHGLLLSSRALFDAQTHYIARQAGHRLDGRLDRIERGLIRYMLRAAVKATPFGTFCAVIPGHLSDETDGNVTLRIQGSLRPLVTSTRLNKMMLAYLMSVLYRSPSLVSHFNVAANPTLEVDGDAVRFLALVQGKETFQTVDRIPVLDVILDHIALGSWRTLGSVIDGLATIDGIDCSRDEAAAFVHQLVDIGMIHVFLGIPQQEPDWDHTLALFLEGTGDEAAAGLEDALSVLRKSVECGDMANTAKWKSAMEAGTAALAAATSAQTSGPFSGMVVHQDATARATATLWRTRSLNQLEADLSRWVQIGVRLAAIRPVQATMREFFVRQYGDGGRCGVPLLRFFEDWYRCHYRDHMDHVRAHQEGRPVPDGYRVENPLGVPFVDTFQEAFRSMNALIIKRLREKAEAEEVVVELEEIEELVDAASPPHLLPQSVAMFGDLVLDAAGQGADRFVTRGLSYGLGHGHFFSRWLHMLPQEMYQAVCESNSDVSGVLLAEISSDGYFNANLHPPLVKAEIEYPCTEGGVTGERISPTMLSVGIDPVDPHALQLTDTQSGKRVAPLDLGFLALSRRPPLYQVLNAFGPPASFAGLQLRRMLGVTNGVSAEGSVPSVANAEPPADATPTVWYRPRIRIGSIVIARRSWTIARRDLPTKAERESDCAFFMRVNRWAVGNRLPAQGFMHFEGDEPASKEEPAEHEREADGSEDSEPQEAGERSRSRGNDRKPQFMDFQSPSLVNLFGALIRRSSGAWLVIEERYPGPAELPIVDGKAYAIELVLQVSLDHMTPRDQRGGVGHLEPSVA